MIEALFCYLPLLLLLYYSMNGINSIDSFTLARKEILHGMRKKKREREFVFRSINGISDKETTEMNRCKYLCGDGGSDDGDGCRLMQFYNVKEFLF